MPGLRGPRPGPQDGLSAVGHGAGVGDDMRRDLIESDVVDPAMKKISALAALTMTGLALAAPAHADNDSTVGPGTKGAIHTHRNPLATNLCKQALALVPVAAPWTGEEVDDACNNRDHPGRA